MDVKTIKTAIEHLSEQDRRALADWLQELEERKWDQEMEHNFAPGGRAEDLAKEIDRNVEEGKFTSFNEGMRSRQGRR